MESFILPGLLFLTSDLPLFAGSKPDDERKV